MEKEVSLHPSQILGDLRGMQAVAAEFPGCAENSTAFGERSLKHFVSIHLFSKPALRQTRSVCLRAS